MKILHSYTPSLIIAVFIPDKRQNMFHELRNWRNHCLHSLLKVPISKIFFKSYISFFVHKVRRLRVSRLPFLEILAILIQTLVNSKTWFWRTFKMRYHSPMIRIWITACYQAHIVRTRDWSIWKFWKNVMRKIESDLVWFLNQHLFRSEF